MDDSSRCALSVTAHRPVTDPIVLATFRASAATQSFPASTLTDNGRVFIVWHFGGTPGRSHLEHELRELNITQKKASPTIPRPKARSNDSSRPSRSSFAPNQSSPPSSPSRLALLDAVTEIYSQQRPHWSLPHRATPATLYTSLPKAAPSGDLSTETHDRVHQDKIDKAGNVTLRVAGQVRHIGVGRTCARTDVTLLANDLHITIVPVATGEILRDLIIDPRKDCQPTGRPPGSAKNETEPARCRSDLVR